MNLQKKIGPLPAWAWLVIGVAGLAAGIYLKNRLAGQTAASTASSGTAASTNGTTYPDLGSTGLSGGSTTGGATGTSGISGLDFSTVQDLAGSFLSYFQSGLQLGQQYAPAVNGGAGAGTSGGTTSPSAPGNGGAAPPAGVPTGTSSTAKALAPGASQNTAGVLSWGGLQFTSKASFQQWAKAHGTSTKTIFASHPEAAKLYGTLK